jgi:hypothetical protein
LKSDPPLSNTLWVILKTNRGSKVALEIEIGYNKKRNQINFTPEKENGNGFFQKNIPSIGINEVRLWVSTRKNVRNAAGGGGLPSWMKPMTTPAAKRKIFVRIAVASISRI